MAAEQHECDDCEALTDWEHAVQLDPWGEPTGNVWCENCAERHWYNAQQRLIEET